MRDPNPRNPPPSSLELDFERDDLGRVARREESLLGGGTEVTSYEYDPAGRLWQVWGGEVGTGILAKEYLYDANGNRLSEAPGNPIPIAVYDAQDRLASYAGATYTYNLAGDLETKTEGGATTTYTYDTLGNLVNVEFEDGRQIEYVIDGQNRRIGKKVCAAPCADPGDPVTGLLLERAWLYQDQLNPVAELDDQGNVVARFVYGSRPNVPDYVVKGGNTYQILSDPLGSPRLVVDASTGAVAQRIDYDAWGNATVVRGTADFQPFGFAGGLHDAETGLVRFGARDYDPAVGRWTAKDPWLFNGSDTNVFGYAFQDPVNYLDRTGTVGLWGAVAGGISGGISAGWSSGGNGWAIAAGVVTGAAVGFVAPHLAGAIAARAGAVAANGIAQLAGRGLQAGVESFLGQTVGNLAQGRSAFSCFSVRGVLGSAVGGAVLGGVGNRAFGTASNALSGGVGGLSPGATNALSNAAGATLQGVVGGLGGLGVTGGQNALRNHWRAGGHPLGRII